MQTPFRAQKEIFQECFHSYFSQCLSYQEFYNQLDEILLLGDRLIEASKGESEFSEIEYFADFILTYRFDRGPSSEEIRTWLFAIDDWLNAIAYFLNPLYAAQQEGWSEALEALQLITEQSDDPFTQMIQKAYTARQQIDEEQERSDEESQQLIEAILVTIIAPLYKHATELHQALRDLITSEIENEETLAQLSLIEDIRQQKVEESKVRRELAKKITNRLLTSSGEQGNYFLVTGFEGTGKTTLVSNIVENLIMETNGVGFSAGHIRAVAPWLPSTLLYFGRCSDRIEQVVRSLVDQANACLINKVEEELLDFQKYEQLERVDDSFQLLEVMMEDYRKVIYRILERLVKERGQALLIIDSLDNIVQNHEEKLGFLPEKLPAGAQVLITARTNSVAEKWLKRRMRPHLWRLSNFSYSEVLGMLETENQEEKNYLLNHLVKKSATWPAYIAFVATELEQGKKLKEVQSFHKNRWLARLADRWESDQLTAEQNRMLKEVQKLLAIFEPVAPLHLDFIHLFLNLQGFQLEKPELRRCLSLVQDQLEGLEEQKVKLKLSALAQYIREDYYDQFDLLPFFERTTAWLLKLKEYFAHPLVTETMARFVWHWTDESKIWQMKLRESVKQLLAQLYEQKNAQLLFEMYSFMRKEIHRSQATSQMVLQYAAMLGHTKAMVALGVHALNGISGKRNSEEGKKWLEQAADLGDLDAMYVLGNRLLDGNGLVRDEQTGKAWLEKATKAGHVDATFSLSQRLLDRQGVERDEEAGKKWLEQLARSGHLGAMIQLGKRLLDRKGVERDELAGRRWLEEAARQDHVGAMIELGRRLLDGRGMERDESRGKAWLEEAAKRGNVGAMFALGSCLLDQKTTEQEKMKGRLWLEEAARCGNVGAMIELGRRLLDGRGMEQDEVQGKAWLKEAAQTGNVGAMIELGRRLLDGRGVAVDEQAGKRWLENVAKAGNVGGIFELGRRLLDGKGVARDEVEGRRWLEKLAEQGNEGAMIELGRRLLDGKGLTKDEAAGCRWIEAAARMGNVEAMVILGNRLLDGRGTELNEQEGRRWLEEAARTGNVKAMIALGNRLLEGRGLKQDEAEGKKWMEEAAKSGNVSAMLELGKRLREGRGLTKNLEEGEKWLKEAQA